VLLLVLLAKVDLMAPAFLCVVPWVELISGRLLSLGV